MSYTALYRKYRPKTFKEVAGQDAVKRTLVNQIKNDRIGHAYLFTGTRGTGKTTVARIFSRAVNCLNPQDGSPCGVCDICKIQDNIDIIEIDGASSNRVEAIRDLKEQVKYPPVNSKYKVYIVDEVHMLTDSSYNALLKTLEEPPEYVIFILATTEPQKIPPTIMSRCMRFDFKLVSTKEIAEIISNVFASSNIKASKEAIELIARSGMGSVRDALSIADMCAGFSREGVTYDDVLELLGASDNMVIGNLAKSILSGDLNNSLEIINQMAESGKSMNVIARDLTTYFRNLGIAKTCKEPNEILGLPKEVLDSLLEISAQADMDKITVCIDIFGSLDQDLRYGLNPRITLENAVFKASRLIINTPNAILARLNELEKKISDLKTQNIVAVETPKEFTKSVHQDEKNKQNNQTKENNEQTEIKLEIQQKPELKQETHEQKETSEPIEISEAYIPPQREGHFIADTDDIFSDGVSVQNIAEKKLGELAYKLRESGEVLLHFQLTNNVERIKLENGVLTATVYDNNSYKLLSEEKSKQKIEKLLNGLKFSVILSEPVDVKYQEKSISRLKELAGSKLEIK
ncbi:MAG TPA: DNA polymerase III subunit gamma/tau [Clostridia bacterium]